MTKKLKSTKGVIRFLGGHIALAQEFDIDPKAVLNWKYFKVFPANTYVPIMFLLKERNQTAPDKLWAMRTLVKRK